jgi:hypothetical protein
LEEVDHIAERIVKLEPAIDEAVAKAAPEIRAVIEALQALRCVAQRLLLRWFVNWAVCHGSQTPAN